MTTLKWAALPACSFGLPEPAVVMPPWIFDVYIGDAEPAGFTAVESPDGWGQVGAASPDLALDLHNPWAAMMISADDPRMVDTDAVAQMRESEAGGLRWSYPFSVWDDAPGATTALETAHARGRVWAVTGDIQRWSAAVASLTQRRYRRERLPTVPFGEMFPHGGCWAASVPLLVRLDRDGAGSCPAGG